MWDLVINGQMARTRTHDCDEEFKIKGEIVILDIDDRFVAKFDASPVLNIS